MVRVISRGYQKWRRLEKQTYFCFWKRSFERSIKQSIKKASTDVFCSPARASCHVPGTAKVSPAQSPVTVPAPQAGGGRPEDSQPATHRAARKGRENTAQQGERVDKGHIESNTTRNRDSKGQELVSSTWSFLRENTPLQALKGHFVARDVNFQSIRGLHRLLENAWTDCASVEVVCCCASARGSDTLRLRTPRTPTETPGFVKGSERGRQFKTACFQHLSAELQPAELQVDHSWFTLILVSGMIPEEQHGTCNSDWWHLKI